METAADILAAVIPDSEDKAFLVKLAADLENGDMDRRIAAIVAVLRGEVQDVSGFL